MYYIIVSDDENIYLYWLFAKLVDNLEGISWINR